MTSLSAAWGVNPVSAVKANARMVFFMIVPLVRGELGVAALHLLFSLFTIGIWQLIVCFLYNKQYMTRMLEKGYVLKDTEENMAKARRALGVVEPVGKLQG